MNIINIIVIIILLLCLYTLLKKRKQKKKDFELKLITIIDCDTKGHHHQVRDFQDGDFMYKILDQVCDVCSRKLRITKIYTNQKTEKEIKWESYEKKFEV